MALYSRERARRAVYHTVGFRGLSQIATVVNYVVLVRGLTEQTLGVYSLLYSVIPVVATVASLGLDSALKRFQPEFLQSGNSAAAAWLLSYVAIARLLSTAAVVVLLLVSWNLVAPLFQLQGHRTDFAVLSVVLILYFQVIILQNSLASHMQHRFSVGSAVVLSLGKLLAYVGFLVVGGLTLRRAIIADTIAYVLTYGFLWLAHWNSCRPQAHQARYRPAPAERKRIKRFALISNFSDASSLLLCVQTDNFFIAALMNPIAVGTYAFYNRLNEMTFNLIPIKLFENVVNPLLFSVRQEQAAERLPRYFTLLVNISLMAQLPLIAFSVVYHRDIVQLLFGGKFIEYSSLLPLIVMFAVSDNVFSTPVTMVAQYTEQTAIILKSQLFGLYQIVAMLTLIPIAGLYGAATATGTLHLFRNAWVWWRVRAHARWANWKSALLSAGLVWGTAIGICWILKALTNWPPIVNMLCGVVTCGVAGLIYIRGPALAPSDRLILAGVLHGRESRILRLLGLLPTGSAA